VLVLNGEQDASKKALRATWKHRNTNTNLLGNHIDIVTGAWQAIGAGIGGNVDSFYEYLLKGAVMFGDNELYQLWKTAYAAVMKYIHKSPWYIEVNMANGEASANNFEVCSSNCYCRCCCTVVRY